MENFGTGILGGLIGSTLTVIISKLLELFQKSKEHKFTLQKIFFEKKLLAAEATITQYTILSNAFTSLIILHEKLISDNLQTEDSVKNTLLKEILRLQEVSMNSSFIITNSINLYFDFNNNQLANNDIFNFYNVLGSSQINITYVNECYNNYEVEEDEKSRELKFQSYLIANDELKSKLQQLSFAYYSFNNHLKAIIKEIREEMKKYDY